MPIPILVADSNREFGILIRQALEESGRFEVSLASSADEAVSLAKDLDFRLAIIDFALPDIEGEKIVERLRALQPGLAVIGIPVDDGDSSEKTRQAGVDGILTKPFYLPNLPDIIQEALGRRLDFHRPVQLSWPRKTAPKSEETDRAEPLSEPVSAGERDIPLSFDAPPPWLTDVDRAAQYLARLTLETSAEAALLVRHRELIAFAGQLPRSQLRELTAQVADSWAEEGRSGAVARFVHLPGTVEDFMLYATGVVPEIVLSLVFSSEVPFGMIRRQAETLAHSLSQVDPAQHSTEGIGDTPEPDVPERLSSQVDKSETPNPKTQSQEYASSEADIQTSQGQVDGESALPEDWIPRPSQMSPSAKLLDELESLHFPEPDPKESIQKADSSRIETTLPQTPALPLDWLPVITHSQRHLPFLTDPEPAETEHCAAKPAASERGSTSAVETEGSPAPTTQVGAVEAPAHETNTAGLSPAKSVEAPQEPSTAGLSPAKPVEAPQEPSTAGLSPAKPVEAPQEPSTAGLSPAKPVEAQQEPSTAGASPARSVDAPQEPSTAGPSPAKSVEAPQEPSTAGLSPARSVEAPHETSTAGASPAKSVEAPQEPSTAGASPARPVEAPQEPPPVVTGPPPSPPPTEGSDPRLRYTVVFAPRFPEHRLAGALVNNLSQWTTRLCLAQDWKAERVRVSEDALLVQIMLPPDVAPAAAVQELSEHLSARIFEDFPHLRPGFSTGGFWARGHMLVSGKTITQSEVDGFVAHLRMTQGLGD